MSQQSQKIYRSKDNRILFGVCAGIAKRYTTDPVLVRIGFVLLSLFNGIGVILYILLFIFIPEEPVEFNGEVDRSERLKDMVKTVEQKAEKVASEVRETAQSIKKEFTSNKQDSDSAEDK